MIERAKEKLGFKPPAEPASEDYFSQFNVRNYEGGPFTKKLAIGLVILAVTVGVGSVGGFYLLSEGLDRAGDMQGPSAKPNPTPATILP